MNDMSVWVILAGSVLTRNILLAHFLGMCSFLACSSRLDTAWGLGLAVTFVLTCTTALNYAVYHVLLVPLGLEFLTYIVFIVVIAAFVQIVEMIMERYSRPLYVALGIFLPLITVNCAILGTSLFMILRAYSFVQSVAFGFGAGLGWTLAIVLMAGLRERMDYSDIPTPLRGAAIMMLVAGVLAMAFMGFAGIAAGALE
jgi:Na+-transporting NADH:ubiquinone oxidoreductase subunit E